MPRSITLAMFSSPAVNLMLSTTVSIAGNVLITRSTGRPFSNGTYRFGSNVSGPAMPPAIQSRMQASARGAGWTIVSAAAPKASRGAPIAIAAIVAAESARRNSRRSSWLDSMRFMATASPSNHYRTNLKLRQHHDAPQDVRDAGRCRAACQPSDASRCQFVVGRRRETADSKT